MSEELKELGEHIAATIDADIRADTIVWVSVSDGDDEFLY